MLFFGMPGIFGQVFFLFFFSLINCLLEILYIIIILNSINNTVVVFWNLITTVMIESYI